MACRRWRVVAREFYTYLVVRTYLHVLLFSSALCTDVWYDTSPTYLLHSYTRTNRMIFSMAVLTSHTMNKTKKIIMWALV